VPTRVYDRTHRGHEVGRSQGETGEGEELAAIQRLDQPRRGAGTGSDGAFAAGPDRGGTRTVACDYGGRSVFGWEAPDQTAEERS
jgi:hypothetical protein